MTLLLLQSGPGAAAGAAATAPVNTVLPGISGTTQVGQTLTTTDGTWTGSPTPTYIYQWKRGGTNISGATASSYLLVTADIAATITATVTATNASGSASATSTDVGPVSSSEAAAFLARTSGLNTTHTNAYTALINGLVADGIWAKLDVLHIYATQDSATAQLNLVSNSYPATANGSPTFTVDRGFTGAAGKYINTGFNPATAGSPKFVLNSAHLSVWNLTNATSNNPDLGGQDGSSHYSHLYTRYIDNNAYFRLNGPNSGDAPIGNSDSRGHYIGNRPNSTAAQGYKNGASIISSAVTSTAVPNVNLYALGINANGSLLGTGYQNAMISIGSSLSSTDATNFYNQLRTYMTAMGVP